MPAFRRCIRIYQSLVPLMQLNMRTITCYRLYMYSSVCLSHENLHTVNSVHVVAGLAAVEDAPERCFRRKTGRPTG